MASRAQFAQLDAIFAGCDAGIYTLPRTLHNLRGHMTAIEKAAGALVEPAPDEYAALDRLSEQLATGGDLDLEPVFTARAATERYDLARRAYMQAAERAGDALVAAVCDLQDEIVRDHFAPAQASLITSVRASHETFSPHGTTPAELMSAPKAARDAYTRIDGLCRDFSHLRQAVARVRQLTGSAPQNDVKGLFSVMRNVEQVWPAVMTNLNVANPTQRPPWPDDGAGYLLFLSGPDVETWCPTVAEQDARWWEVFGERVEQNRRNRDNLTAARNTLGPVQKSGGLVGMPGPGGNAA